MERLAENRQQVEPVSAQLLAVLDDAVGKAAVASLVRAWDGLDTLQQAYADYRQRSAGIPAGTSESRPGMVISQSAQVLSTQHDQGRQPDGDHATVEGKNTAQRALSATFVPFFTALLSFPRSSVGMPCGRSASGPLTGRGAPAHGIGKVKIKVKRWL